MSLIWAFNTQKWIYICVCLLNEMKSLITEGAAEMAVKQIFTNEENMLLI